MQWRVFRIVIIVGSLFVLAASSSYVLAASQPVKPDKLHILRLAFANEPPEDATVNATKLVPDLYTHTRALHKVPTDQACPALAGPEFQLTFYRKGQVILDARARKSGCGSVKFGENDIRETDDAFWSLISKALAI